MWRLDVLQLTRDKPERKCGWIGNEIEIWGSPSDRWLQRDVWFLAPAWAPDEVLGRK